MFAPVVTLIFYFLQPGGSFIDAADPADGAATIAAMVSNAGLGKVVSIVIPIGLLVFLSGILVLQENVRSNGNGGALSRIAVLFILAGYLSAEMIPENGTELNYTQVFFRWNQIPGVESYQFTVQNMETGEVIDLNILQNSVPPDIHFD